jgi:hypothetical protein
MINDGFPETLRVKVKDIFVAYIIFLLFSWFACLFHGVPVAVHSGYQKSLNAQIR